MPFDFTNDPRPKVPLSQVIVSEDRARKDYSLVPSLIDSIKEFGLLEPIVLNERTDGKYDLMDGATRFRACMMIPEMGGMIPFTYLRDVPPLRRKEIELEANVCRQDMNNIEKLECIRQIDALKTQVHGLSTPENPAGWNIKKTAELIGKDPSQTAKELKLAKKLKERPDLVKQVENLPISSMIRVVENIEEAEKVGRLHASGQIQLTSELVNGDCREWLKGLKENSVDLWLTDPPFGMETLVENAKASGPGGSVSFQSVMKASDNLCAQSAMNLMKEVLPLMFKALKPSRHAYIFFELELLGELKSLIESSGFQIQYPVLIWDKGRTTSVFKGYSYAPAYEAILFCCKPGEPSSVCRRLSKSVGAILRHPVIDARKKLHIFEKPATLLTDLIEVSTNHGDLVGDPFAGSGSTLLTAKQMGRSAVGCELDQEHFLRAQGRLLLSGVSPKEAKS